MIIFENQGLCRFLLSSTAIIAMVISCGGGINNNNICDEPENAIDDGLNTGGVHCEYHDGIDMCLVSAGNFMMGIKEHYENGEPVEAYDCRDDGPFRSVWVDEFWMDRTEVTVRQYLECVQAGKCGLFDSIMFGGLIKGKHDEIDLPEYNKRSMCNYWHPHNSQYPMNCVNEYQAYEYCLWRGKRLPTEAEWEKAARGTEGNQLPWGNGTPSCEDSVLGSVEGEDCVKEVAQKVCTHPKDVSPYGICDMLGNVMEWTDLHDYKEGQSPNYGCGSIGAVTEYYHPRMFVRGGGFDTVWNEFLLSRRLKVKYIDYNFDWSEDLGFRCASD